MGGRRSSWIGRLFGELGRNGPLPYPLSLRGEGNVCCLCEGGANFLKCQVSMILQYIGVPQAKNIISVFLKKEVAITVMLFTPFMTASIQFDNQFFPMTAKVRNVPSHRLLSAKLQTAEPFFTKVRPQLSFCRSHIRTKCSGERNLLLAPRPVVSAFPGNSIHESTVNIRLNVRKIGRDKIFRGMIFLGFRKMKILFYHFIEQNNKHSPPPRGEGLGVRATPPEVRDDHRTATVSTGTARTIRRCLIEFGGQQV